MTTTGHHKIMNSATIFLTYGKGMTTYFRQDDYQHGSDHSPPSFRHLCSLAEKTGNPAGNRAGPGKPEKAFSPASTEYSVWKPGYQAYNTLGRVYYQQSGIQAAPVRTHLVTIVQLEEGLFLFDPGFLFHNL